MSLLRRTETRFSALVTLLHNKNLLSALVAVVVLAVVGTTLGYASLRTDVRLTVDGEPREVAVMGDTVADVLEAEGLEVTERDIVAPGPETRISDGSRVTVRFARPLELTIDGRTETHWVTSTEVASVLGEIGKSFPNARLSVSRGVSIERDGLEMAVVTPKKLKVAVRGAKAKKMTLTAVTVAEALNELGIEPDENDVVEPALDTAIDNGDKVVFTEIKIRKKRVKGEDVAFGTTEKADDSLFKGTSEVEREGVAGKRNVTYRVIYRNGKVVKRKELAAKVTRKPVARVVRVGTQEQPAPNFASGGTVWDRLAQCESGGNWAINTGNGYYGGLQFNINTWRAYGGQGFPHQNSRAQQIAVAERLRAATGGYGSWPGCASKLGLPR